MLWTALKAKRRRLRIFALASLIWFSVFLSLGILVHPIWIYGGLIGVFAVVSVNRRSQGTAIVLWLRKFGASDSERSIFHIHLGGCCAGMAVPVTIQDSSLQFSYQEASMRSLRTFPVEMALFAPFFVLLCLLLFWLADASSFRRYFTALIILSLLALVPLARRQYKRTGVFPLMQPETVERFLQQIKAGKPGTSGGGGLAVIKVEDAKWPAAVEIALQHTDVLVADVSRLSPNITWELARARQHLVPRQIIFAYGVSPGEHESVPDDVKKALASVLGAGTVAESPWFLYTKRRLRRQFVQWHENKARTLQLMALIAFALCHADPGVTFREIQDDLNSEVVFNQLLLLGLLGMLGLLVWWSLVSIRLWQHFAAWP